MLHRIAFFFVQLERSFLYIWVVVQLVFISIQSGWYSISISFKTSLPYFESGQQAWYNFHSSIHIQTYLSVEAIFLHGTLVPEWHLLFCIAEVIFQLLDQPEIDLLVSSHTQMEAYWLSTVLNILEDVPHHYPMVKCLVRDVFVG